MPFALVAVVLLLVTSYSVVMIAEIDGSEEAIGLRQRSIAALDEAVNETVDHLRSLSVSVLMSIANDGLDLDGDALESLLQARMDEAISANYPRNISGICREVTSSEISLRMLFLADSPGQENSRSYPAYALVTGIITMDVAGGNVNLTAAKPFEANVPVPLPLLNMLLKDHETSMQGSRSELGRLLSYQLGALAQVRALSGTAAVGNATPLLQESDVRRSLESSLDVLERLNLRSQHGDTDLPVDASVLDPANLLLDMMGEDIIDLNRMLAQALFAIVDKTVLRWLEYLDFIRIPLGFLDQLRNDLQHALDLLLDKAGMDIQSVRYLKERMSDAGVREEDYRWLNPSGARALELPSLRVPVLRDGSTQDAQLSAAHVTVLVPRTDIFANELWQAFLPIHNQRTYDLARQLQELVRHAVVLIAESSQLPVLSLDAADGVAFHQQLVDRIGDSMPLIEDALLSRFNQSLQSFKSSDPLGLDLLSFIGKYRGVLFQEESLYNRLKAAAVDSYMVELLRSRAVDGLDLGDHEVLASLRTDIEFAMSSNGLMTLLREKATQPGDSLLELFSAALVKENQNSGAMALTLARLASGLVSTVPGMAESVSSAMKAVAVSISAGHRSISGHGPQLLPGEGLRLQDGKGRQYLESVEVERSGLDSLSIWVVQPHDVRGGAIHYTGLDDWTLAPYLSTVVVRVQGELGYTLTSGSNPLLPESKAMKDIVIDIELRIPVLSGWPLQGVDYRPSNTLGGDLTLEIMRNALPMLVHLQETFGACDALFSFVASVNSRINAFATDVMVKVAEAVLAPVLALQRAMDEGLASLLGGRLGALLEDGGRIRWSTDLFGLRLEFEANPLEIALGMTKDILRMTMSVNVSDVHLSVSLRLLRMAAGDFYILGTGNLAMSDWYVSMTIDPAMRVFRHLVEVKGTIGEKGFQINFPQVMQYETYSLRLSQIPALAPFLSSIPLPIPGMKGSVDAGLELRYDLPTATNVVINEVELNPRGPDSGNEWIELFNPLSREVSLKGWTVSTGQGGGRLWPLPDISLAPGQYLVHVFPVRTLNNGDSMTLPRGESVLLWDAEGHLIDSTPWLIDTDDDERTWQRSHDASDRWEFAPPTRGESNGPRSHGADLGQWFIAELRAAANIAMNRMAKLSADMDGFSDLLHSTLEILIDRTLQKMASCIVEMKLFIHLGVSDLSSSFSAGLELALVAGREFVLEGLRWMLASVRQAVSEAMNPGNSVDPSTGFLLSEAHLRLSFITSMGPPDFIGKLTEDDRYEMKAMVQMNLAAISDLTGRAQDDKRIGFGVAFCNVPGVLLPPMFKAQPGKGAEVWVMRGSFTY